MAKIKLPWLRSLEKQVGSVDTPKTSCSLGTLDASRRREIRVLPQVPQKSHAMVGSR